MYPTTQRTEGEQLLFAHPEHRVLFKLELTVLCSLIVFSKRSNVPSVVSHCPRSQHFPSSSWSHTSPKLLGNYLFSWKLMENVC